MPQLGLNWKQYLSDEDCHYLIQYIENVRHDINNDQMVLLSGSNGTGMSAIKHDIKTYLGGDLCGNYLKVCDIISCENIRKLGFVCDVIDDTCTHSLFSQNKKKYQSLINFIKYKQSLIAFTADYEKVNSLLIERCRILLIK